MVNFIDTQQHHVDGYTGNSRETDWFVVWHVNSHHDDSYNEIMTLHSG